MNNTRKSRRRSRRRQKNRASEWKQLCVFYVLPFIILNSLLFYIVTTKPSLTCTVSDTNDYLSAEVSVHIKSFFPTRQLSVTMDGEELELTKEKNRSYKATVYKNGSIEATVLNFNGMSATAFEHVNVLDDNPPSVENAAIVDGVLTLTVTDSQSGVDPDSVYALDQAGERVEPLSADRSACTFSFPMKSGSISIISADKAGNESRNILTANGEGGIQTSEESASSPEVTAD